jgi:hypothetical protein
MGIRDDFFYNTNDFVAKNNRPALYIVLPPEEIQAFMARFKAVTGYNIGVNRSDPVMTDLFGEIMLKRAYGELEEGSELLTRMEDSDHLDNPYRPNTWDDRTEAITDKAMSSRYTTPDDENRVKSFIFNSTGEKRYYTPYNRYITDKEIDKRYEEIRKKHNG